MAILKEVTVEQPVNAARVARPFAGFAQERPRAKIWGNVALVIGGELVTLPLGLPIDTMEPASVTGQNVAVVKLNAKKNKVLEAFKAVGNSMAPGETKVIGDATVEGNLVFQLRRVSEDLEIVPEAGELDVNGIMGLLTGKAKAPVAVVKEEEPQSGSPSKEELKAQIAALTKAMKALS